MVLVILLLIIIKCNCRKGDTQMESKYKTHIRCLSFDITRRCNLNCDWCLKGDSENIDITSDIIDSTFDKTKDMCMHSIGIFGG